MRKGLKLDNVSTFWSRLKNSECYDEKATYTVDITVREHNTLEVREAKEKVIKNLMKFDVFEEVG